MQASDFTDTPHPSCYVIHETGISTQPSAVAVHAEHGLIFVRDGWFTMEQQYPALSPAGSVTVVPAGVPHRPLAGENLDYWLLGFSAGGFGFEETQAVMRPFADVRLGSAPVVKLDGETQTRLIYWFTSLAREATGQTDIAFDMQRSLITLILAEVARAMPRMQSHSSRSPLIAKALQYIQQNSLSPISLRDVAAAVGRSSPHVAAVIKSETGFTVGTWITSARVAKAAQILRYTDMAIDQIAPHVGWQDTTHFIRQFRKTYGMTPAAWRKSQSRETARE